MTHDDKTYDLALRLLTFRARSVAELRRQLLRKGQAPELVEEVVERLQRQRLLDDAEFARQFARSKLLGAGVSRRRIVSELSRRGVSRQVAESAITDLSEREGIDPLAAVQIAATKKWRSLARLDAATRRRRLYAYLARRGFDPDEIRTVMQTLGDELPG